MQLLELDNMIGIPTAEASQIKEFNTLIKKDRTHNKRKASKQFAYIYYLVHWDSPYAAYPEDIRKTKVIKDIFEDEQWTPSEEVEIATAKYKELTQNEFKKMLEAARVGAYKLTEYFNEIDLNELDKNDKPIHSARDLISNLEKVGKVMEGIEKLVEMVEKNEGKDKQNRAGVETNKYNEG